MTRRDFDAILDLACRDLDRELRIFGCGFTRDIYRDDLADPLRYSETLDMLEGYIGEAAGPRAALDMLHGTQRAEA